MRIAGSWTIARPFGVPLRIHWSVPVCALLAGGVRVAPGAWLAFLLLVIIHEMGHLLVVRRAGARPVALDILGIGGLCSWEGSVTPIQRACIAWGGVWAQMVVLVITSALVLLLGRPASPFANQMVDVAITSNLWLIGLNLLPLPPLDGAEAWSLFSILHRRFRARREARHAARRAADVGAAPMIIVPPRRAPVVREAPRVTRPATGGPSHKPRDDFDDIADGDYTPEVLEVLERTRSIARDAARDPAGAGRASDPDKDNPRS